MLLKPQYLAAILQGEKTVEVRKERHAQSGETVWLMATGSDSTVYGSVVIGESKETSIDDAVAEKHGLDEAELRQYADSGATLHIWPLSDAVCIQPTKLVRKNGVVVYRKLDDVERLQLQGARRVPLAESSHVLRELSEKGGVLRPRKRRCTKASPDDVARVLLESSNTEAPPAAPVLIASSAQPATEPARCAAPTMQPWAEQFSPAALCVSVQV